MKLVKLKIQNFRRLKGDTETIVYRDLLKRFYSNEEIFVLNTGSKNNIPFFQEILTKFQINHFVIHDIDVEKVTDKDGKERTNSAWTLNQNIWDKIESANQVKNGLARRYVHITNFETAHGITLSGSKDKPLKAYQFVKEVKNEDNIPDCLKWLNDIVGKQEVLHDMNYIETNKKS